MPSQLDAACIPPPREEASLELSEAALLCPLAGGALELPVTVTQARTPA
jgi:hypothetical protein